MKTHRRLLAVLCASAWAGAAWGQGSLVAYDAFSTPALSAKKWRTWESLRTVEAGKLRLLHRAHGTPGTSAGGHWEGRGQFFPETSKLTSIRATVRVDRVEATGCPGNPETTAAMARIAGDFFNLGTPSPGSAAGDVLADLRIERRSGSGDPANTLRVVAQIYRCDDAGCLSGESLGYKDLGTVKLRQATKLSIEWDRARHRFLFQRDAQPKAILAYSGTDTAAPGRINKALLVEHFVVNCASGQRPTALIDASFDDVFVNPSAANPQALEAQEAGAKEGASGTGGGAQVVEN